MVSLEFSSTFGRAKKKCPDIGERPASLDWSFFWFRSQPLPAIFLYMWVSRFALTSQHRFLFHRLERLQIVSWDGPASLDWQWNIACKKSHSDVSLNPSTSLTSQCCSDLTIMGTLEAAVWDGRQLLQIETRKLLMGPGITSLHTSGLIELILHPVGLN